MLFTDTHCHLNYHNFQTEVDTLIQDAANVGVGKILIPGFNLPSSRDAITISERHASCFAAVGIHPNDGLEWNDSTEDELRLMLQHPRVLALGEIGLDYYRDHAPHDLQQQIFRRQLTLAEKAQKPVLIHIRESQEDCFEMLFNWQYHLVQSGNPLAERPGILHAFPGSLDEALLGSQHHFKIGIGGPVTFKNAQAKQHMAAHLPLDNIVLETDAPFLAPHPHRGKRNEPVYIPLIAQKIAELRNISVEEIGHQTTVNAQTVLQWG